MFKNFIVSAIRSIRRQGVVSGISIFGLACALSVSLLIILYVVKEFSYDKFEQSSQIYRLELKQISDQSPKWAISHYNTVKEISSRSLDITEVMFYKKRFQVTKVQVEDKKFYERNVVVSNSQFASFTDLKMLYGDKKKVLTNPNEVILSKDYAEKYFGNGDVLGQVIVVDTASYLVSGVFETTKPSHLSADVIISESENVDLRWLHTYIKIREGADLAQVLDDINNNAPELSGVFYNDTEYDIINIQDIHFKSTSKFQLGAGGNIDTVNVLLGIGILILVIASINFINLTSAVFAKAEKESAIRRVLGSSKLQLLHRFFVQSGLLLMVSIFLGIGFFLLMTPMANNALDLKLDYNELNFSWLSLAVLAMVIVFAFTNVLTITWRSKENSSQLIEKKQVGMNFLMVFQFASAIMLIVGTFLVRDQLNYLHNKYLGYGDDALLFVTLDDQSLWTNTTEFRKRFEAHPAVLYTSSIMGAPGDPSMMGNQNAWAEGMAQGENIFIPLYAGEEEFVETMGLNLIAGSNFNQGVNANDSIAGILVNETAVQQFGWEEPIGKRMRISESPCRVVGVVEDFHFLDLHQPIGPLVIVFRPNNHNIAVRINRNGLDSALDFIEEEWKGIDQEHPFNYFFLKENFERQYQSEARLIQVLNALSVLALAICAIGILGMVILIMDERTKEIGVRKVLGASIYQIILLLNKKVLILLITANIIAWPFAYYLGNNWLQSFAYRTNIGVMVFLIASVIIVSIVLITISFHSVKLALKNPVESLRHE
ncbi:MAG: ABC transporter permease [Ekhidna sp.]